MLAAMRSLLLIAIVVLALAWPAAATARSSYCSPSGDICYGAVGTGATVKLEITLAARYFTRYTLCVSGPGGADCKRFRVHRAAFGTYASSVRWVRHFPGRGPGLYRATWKWGGVAFKPSVTFREGPSIDVEPRSVRPGDEIRVFGLAGGCPKGDAVTLTSRAFPHTDDFAGVPAVFTPVRAGDRYSVRVRIPAGQAPGEYTIGGRCGGGNFGVEGRFTVT
jgi:hypothetical protein